MDDPVVQERTILLIQQYPYPFRSNIIFYFCPFDPSIGMFAPPVHPSSLVSYRSKVSVLRKLCDIYVEGRLDIAELGRVLACNYDVWCLTLYNLLPPDEQQFHRYLNKVTIKVDSKASIEKQYVQERISLQTFEDLKFPDRKKKKVAESLTYPRPYEISKCVICKCNNAIIKCQNCNNMVCPECVRRVFLDPDTRIGSCAVRT